MGAGAGDGAVEVGTTGAGAGAAGASVLASVMGLADGIAATGVSGGLDAGKGGGTGLTGLPSVAELPGEGSTSGGGRRAVLRRDFLAGNRYRQGRRHLGLADRRLCGILRLGCGRLDLLRRCLDRGCRGGFHRRFGRHRNGLGWLRHRLGRFGGGHLGRLRLRPGRLAGRRRGRDQRRRQEGASPCRWGRGSWRFVRCQGGGSFRHRLSRRRGRRGGSSRGGGLGFGGRLGGKIGRHENPRTAGRFARVFFGSFCRHGGTINGAASFDVEAGGLAGSGSGGGVAAAPAADGIGLAAAGVRVNPAVGTTPLSAVDAGRGLFATTGAAGASVCTGRGMGKGGTSDPAAFFSVAGTDSDPGLDVPASGLAGVATGEAEGASAIFRSDIKPAIDGEASGTRVDGVGPAGDGRVGGFSEAAFSGFGGFARLGQLGGRWYPGGFDRFRQLGVFDQP